MEMNLSFVKETLDLNREELAGNKELTNELLIDDIMIELGYNMKRNLGVRRFYGSDIDWAICIDGHNRFVVKTIGYGNEISPKLSNTKEEIDTFDLIIITDGERFTIYNLKSEDTDPIFDINIFNDSDAVNEILTYISMDEYAVEKLQELYESSLLNTEKIIAIIHNNTDVIVQTILEVGEIRESKKNLEIIKEWTAKLGVEDTELQELNRATIEGLTNEISSLQDQAAQLEDAKMTQLKMIEELNTNISNIQDQVEQLEDEKIEHLKMIEELERGKSGEEENVESQEHNRDNIDGLTTKISNLQDKVAQLEDEKMAQLKLIEEIKSGISNGEADTDLQEYTRTTIAGLNSKISNLQNQVEQLEDENTMHLKVIGEIKSETDKEAADTGNKEEDTGGARLIGEFRYKIANLMNDNSLLKSDKKELEVEIERLKSLVEAKREAINDDAKALLASISDSDDTARAYVAVINTKLFQNENLHKFIGTCIEELYGIVSVKLMPIIFDGDVFKLIQPAVRKDFTINNKFYDISIDTLSEDEALAKLVRLFNKFADVILECKIIGSTDNMNEGVTSQEDSLWENREDDEEDDIKEEVDSLREEEEAVENNIEFDDDIVDTEIAAEETHKESFGNEKLIAIPICKLSSIAWSEGVKLNTVGYVGKDDAEVYKIENTSHTISEGMSITLAKIIESMIDMCDNFSESLTALKQADLSTISKYLEPISNENKSNPRIALTRFVINRIDEVAKFVPIINGIASILKIDTETAKLYIYGVFNNNSEVLKYIVDEESIQLGYNTEFIKTEQSEKKAFTLISGSITDSVALTKSSLRIQANLFEKCAAVKTNYMTLKIEDENDVISVITKIIEQGLDEGNEIDTLAVGKVLDSDYMIISESATTVSTSFVTLNVRGKAYFVSEMEEWQLIYALIKLHYVVCKNKSIGLNVKVNVEAYEFYTTEFRVSDPSFRLAVRSIVEYVKDRIKHY